MNSAPPIFARHVAAGVKLLALPLILFLGGCGYGVATHRSASLPNVRTISIPLFQNDTFQYKIEQSLTAAVIHEFLSRTTYQVQQETEGSDAILRGVVTSISSGPIVVDPQSGRTTKVLMTVGVRVTLLDNKSGQPILNATDTTYRETYDVSTDSATYFAENGPALERLNRDVAASVVSRILESF